ncbi:MAG: hypothetical protein ACD_79C00739G0026 [uncultured bacterium]|nr:MAG: hypothetical protein ACD_79C00739G0026 [uncultured bacterium]
MIILGCETSCDETSVSFVKDGFDVLGVKTLSQIKTHEKYGGVVPEIASRIHVESIHHLLNDLVKETNISLKDIDYLAVTNTPGLIGALLVGVSFTNSLGYFLKKSVIPINHLEAHIYAAFMTNTDLPELPALALLVSGGHTMLIKVNKIGEYEILGTTLDDAVGEAFDKTAKLLGLPYPGGPVIDKLAKTGDPFSYQFPRALLKNKNNFDFSFSGLKTAVLYTIYGFDRKTKIELNETNIANICASFQKAAVDTLVQKTRQAIQYINAKSLIVCGGVAANSELKKEMLEAVKEFNIKAHIPPIKYCTDNATMVAGLAYHKIEQAEIAVKEVKSNCSL